MVPPDRQRICRIIEGRRENFFVNIMSNINIGKSVSVFLTTLIVFSLFTITKIPTAIACSCIRPGAPNEELVKSTAVFSGQVLSVNRDFLGYGYKVKFDVEKIWKGVSGKTIVVSTGLGGGDCGFGFEEGKKYIVYAYGENSLNAGICSRTHLLTQADTDIAVLGEGMSPASEVGLNTKSNFSSTTVAVGIILVVLVGIIYKIIALRKKLS